MELSIVIVSFNTGKLLDNCLSSVFAALKFDNLFSESEVIVVDNASNDSTVEMLEKRYPYVILIKNNKNVGFARANNQGIRKSTGDKILLLNSDTKLIQGALKKFISILDRNEKLGVIGPRLINSDNSIQPSAGFFPRLPKIFYWMFFIDDFPVLDMFLKPYHMKNPDFYKKNNYADWISGAAFLLRRDIIRKAGLFDENIFMYGEEVEWCYRIKKAGYELLYTPLMSVVHLKGGSGEGGTAGIIEEYKSVLYLFRKHMPHRMIPCLRILLISGALLRILLFGIILMDTKKISKYAKAIQVVG